MKKRLEIAAAVEQHNRLKKKKKDFSSFAY